MKRFLSITLAITTTLWLVGTMFVPAARAAVVDGDVVSPDATFVDADGNTYYSYDVFIVKIIGTKTFKRLVLNPQVFASYGHLKWSNIKTISAATVKGYTTSALVRAINDAPVYVLAPNGDTGTKQWVDDLTCFNGKGYDWDSVYTINATDRDNYTTVSSLCGGAAAGPITLSLASDNPPAATLPLDAQGVSFLKVKVDGTGTVNQITIARKGAGEVDDFGDIYIYKDGTRIGSGRSLSSATSKVTFINLGISAPATFEVVADMATDNAGNVSYFAVESSSDVTGTGTVGGVFPINGNPMASSGTLAGTVTVTASGSGSRNVTVGGTEQEISQFKVAVATEGGYLKRVRFYNSGTADNDKVTNLKLKDNTGVTVATATSISSSGYLDFVLSSPYYIKKGDSEIFRVYADIGGVKPTYTVILYLELATDILATGNIYGYGMKATISDFDGAGSTSTKGINVTCVGGDLTLNKIGPNADNVGTDTDDTVFLEYSITAAADITFKRTELIFCKDDSGGGTFNDASESAGADITDIKVIDKDTGTTILGPKDGIAFDNNGAAGNAASGTAGYQTCPGTKLGLWEAFTDTFDISAGQKRTFQVTADIDISATDSGTDLVAADGVEFILYSYASMVGTTGNVSYMKYAGTTDAVDDSVIVPSGNIAGEEMTIEAPSLALTLAATPSGNDAGASEKVYIAGQSGVEAVGIIFTAGAASDITVNSISLVSFITENTGVTSLLGKDTNYVKDSIGAVYIYDTTTGALIPGSTAKGFTSGDDSEHVDYSGLSWTIPAGESRTMLVKVDISSAAPASLSTADTWIAFDIENVGDVSAVDKDGTSVTLATADPNGGTTPTTNFGIADYGSMAIAVASDTPDKSLLVMGTNDNAVSKFKLTGALEAWKIEKFAIGLYDGNLAGTNADPKDSDNFSGVALKYQTESQWGTSNWTISPKKTFEATASLAFNFTDDNRIYVPKDDSTYITVLVDVKGYLGGAGAKSKVPVMINHSTSELTGFKAYGAQSGRQETTLTTTTVPNTSLALHFIARSKPVFAKSAWSGGETELARFTITAVGYDVFFNGDDAGADDAVAGGISSASLRFDVIASSGQPDTTASTQGILTLYDWTEAAVSSDTVTYGIMDVDTTNTSTSFLFEMKDVTIPSGTTKEFHIDLAGSDLSDFDQTDEYIYLKFTNDAAAFGDLATDDWDTIARSVVWDDGTLEEGLGAANSADGRYGMPEDIMNIGTLPLVFRTLRGTAAP
jgi:hypothetical protein